MRYIMSSEIREQNENFMYKYIYDTWLYTLVFSQKVVSFGLLRRARAF